MAQLDSTQDAVEYIVKVYSFFIVYSSFSSNFSVQVIVVGDLGVGKTSFIKRYVDNTFSREYKSTIGVDFATKLIQISEDKVVRLQLWDIAGQERYGSMTRVFFSLCS
jgi:small GTP-binding protein